MTNYLSMNLLCVDLLINSKSGNFYLKSNFYYLLTEISWYIMLFLWNLQKVINISIHLIIKDFFHFLKKVSCFLLFTLKLIFFLFFFWYFDLLVCWTFQSLHIKQKSPKAAVNIILCNIFLTSITIKRLLFASINNKRYTAC